MRVIVTGSRDWPSAPVVFENIKAVAAECPDNRLRIRHGGCKQGADVAAHYFCEINPSVGADIWTVEETYWPDWVGQGKVAGFWRNRRMVDDGAELCLAFLMPCLAPKCKKAEPHDSHGASHCAEYAERAGIPVRRYRI